MFQRQPDAAIVLTVALASAPCLYRTFRRSRRRSRQWVMSHSNPFAGTVASLGPASAGLLHPGLTDALPVRGDEYAQYRSLVRASGRYAGRPSVWVNGHPAARRRRSSRISALSGLRHVPHVPGYTSVQFINASALCVYRQRFAAPVIPKIRSR